MAKTGPEAQLSDSKAGAFFDADQVQPMPANARDGEQELNRAIALMLLAALTAVAAYLRFSGLADASIWFDEAVSWSQSRGNFVDMLWQTSQDNHLPLYNTILFLVIHLFGDSEWLLRFPSAVFGVLTVPAVYWVGTLVHSRRAGLIAALVITLSSFSIYYSHEARMYSLLPFVATLYAGASLAFARKSSLARTVFLAVIGAALVYTHIFGILTWAALASITGLEVLAGSGKDRRTLVRFALAQIAIVGSVLPWVSFVIERIAEVNTRGFWIARPDVPGVASMLDRLFDHGAPLFIVGAGLAAVTLFASRRTGDVPTRPLWVLAALLSWAILPFLIGLAVSLVSQPILLDRYLVGSLPAWAVLLGVGYGSRFETPLQFGFVGVVLTTVLGWSLATAPPVSRHDDWRRAGALVSDALDSESCVLLPLYNKEPLQFYVRDLGPCVIEIATPTELEAKIPSSATRLILASSDWNDGFLNSVVAVIERHWLLSARANLKGTRVLVFDSE